nr:ribonuclease H-like domain-containing protein [Tanacetum cinerariifolium]
MYYEYKALIKNNIWVLVPKPPNVKVVWFMWLFRHKYHADGSLSRYKDHLVANGRSQQFGVDSDDTFSQVVKPATIRTVFSLALSHNWPINQLDVKNAFFNGDLSETVYMYQLPGFVDAWSHMANCNPTWTPIDTESKLSSDGDLISVPTLYRSLAALKRVLRYVHGILDFGLQLYASITSSLVAYTDADWAGCLTTRRSTSGNCVSLGDNLLSWILFPSSIHKPSLSLTTKVDHQTINEEGKKEKEKEKRRFQHSIQFVRPEDSRSN